MAKRPTAPAPPCTSTRSPVWSLARSNTPCHAVSAPMGTEAASTCVKPVGFGAILLGCVMRTLPWRHRKTSHSCRRLPGRHRSRQYPGLQPQRRRKIHVPVWPECVSRRSSCEWWDTTPIPLTSHQPHEPGSKAHLGQVAVVERLLRPTQLSRRNQPGASLSFFTSASRQPFWNQPLTSRETEGIPPTIYRHRLKRSRD